MTSNEQPAFAQGFGGQASNERPAEGGQTTSNGPLPVAALIPAHNDAYTLRFCLASVAPHVREVVVLDDCSTDETPDVALAAAGEHRHVRLIRHEGRQLGWIEARNRLMAATQARRLLFLDADDVLVERNLDCLREIAAGDRPLVRLRLCELWGDLRHTTQRWSHTDRCHCYADRGRMKRLIWGHAGSFSRPEVGVRAAASEALLAFHAKGVKPDRRLVERCYVRPWLRAGRPTATVAEFADLGAMSDEAIHRRAVEFLTTSRQDRPRLAYLCGVPVDGAPELPRVLWDALPGRFRFTYSGGQITDRIDRNTQERGEPHD
ncbi:MAG: glycosyltransferase family 2 protein [Planctomycetota bacterium]